MVVMPTSLFACVVPWAAAGTSSPPLLNCHSLFASCWFAVCLQAMAARSRGGNSMAMTACFAGPLFNMLVRIDSTCCGQTALSSALHAAAPMRSARRGAPRGAPPPRHFQTHTPIAHLVASLLLPPAGWPWAGLLGAAVRQPHAQGGRQAGEVECAAGWWCERLSCWSTRCLPGRPSELPPSCPGHALLPAPPC